MTADRPAACRRPEVKPEQAAGGFPFPSDPRPRQKLSLRQSRPTATNRVQCSSGVAAVARVRASRDTPTLPSPQGGGRLRSPESGLGLPRGRVVEEVERDAKYRCHPQGEAEKHQYEEQHPTHHWFAPHTEQPGSWANPCGTVRCVRSVYLGGLDGEPSAVGGRHPRREGNTRRLSRWEAVPQIPCPAERRRTACRPGGDRGRRRRSGGCG
jgi:hypothetical protein